MARGTGFEGFSFGLHAGGSRISQFIIEARRGDAAAFQELVQSYDATVMRITLALTGSHDSAQEIYLRVFRDAFASVNKLDSSRSVFVWLHQILTKHCIEYCRGNQGYSATNGPRNLAEVLCALPPTERIVFLLKHSQGLKIGTVAEIFGCSAERIANILESATIALRAELKPPFPKIA